MKTLKITLTLAAVALLTVSGVKSDDFKIAEEHPTYKDYSPKDLLAINKKKAKLKTQG